MEETLEGGRGPPRAVEPLERENMDIRTTFLETARMMSDIAKCLLVMVFVSSSQQYE